MATTKAKTTKKTTERQELNVKTRDALGKRRTRRLRDEGFIPGVIYGKGVAPVSVAVPQSDLVKVLHSKMGEHALLTLRLEGASSWEKAALVKTVQHDPVSGHVVHVDFHAIALTERLKVKVPLLLKGEAIGVKQENGILEHFLREVEVECLPADIPAAVEFDVSALTIGDTVHVRDLTAPANTKITSDPDGVVASLQKPKEEKPEEEAAAAVTEPEVLREKKPEEGEAAEAKAETPEPKKEKEAKS
ncbi:MAG: 50S ribosomal protein L25 [Candidatus Omnitrophica bacterium CG11_big_fil_rev_8_21_14_0_20_63_9]|nr:MAG: 50S ribosomal protein L25 [Candidatus Omnitrophica bacterium CG11_big_fil_rev_8_21_14_0_20_63_9]